MPCVTQVWLLLAILVGYCVMGILCGVDNEPKIDTRKVWDCTELRHTEICHITFVVESLLSMTFYNITNHKREWRGYRAAFTSPGKLSLLETDDPSLMEELTIPATVDGFFRPIIAINTHMPGPTIIAHDGQVLSITVYNELLDVKGISVHWHGMHQVGSPKMDGLAYITQRAIMPYQSFRYRFRASPAGTHWYHAHSGAQRTDGLLGALIVKELTTDSRYTIDLPDQHTLILTDWFLEASIDVYQQIHSRARFWKEVKTDFITEYTVFASTLAADGTLIGYAPFWSATINGKGRHYNENGEANFAEVSYFNVVPNQRYRFRLIGTQSIYALRFSIEGHKLTVISTDGFKINSITDVDYVIIHSAERYDVVVDTSGKDIRDYWILAETLEVDNGDRFHNPVAVHRAEAVLHYEGADKSSIQHPPKTWTCTKRSKCLAVNCPFKQYGDIMNCVNVDEFRSSFYPVDPRIYDYAETKFYGFGFDGDASITSSSVDGVNFRFPPRPPLVEPGTEYSCPGVGCDHKKLERCSCTSVTHIEYERVVEFVFVNRIVSNSAFGSSHPIHMHGHSFYVVKAGYPNYDKDGKFVSPNDDIECIVPSTQSSCKDDFITIEEEVDGKNTVIQRLQWKKSHSQNVTMTEFSKNNSPVRKDTVMVPFGGYVVIKFISDNPGLWFLHCHIEPHQLEGMAAVISELKPYILTTADEEVNY